tara:strand:- start:753 stop:2543 length:1791 start_codon:yes stop_codon:yes gene_type:complete
MSIKNQLAELTHDPGIYKMLNEDGDIIYIGKAKNLKKRVSSYFTKTHQDIKTTIMVKHIVQFETIVTQTEKEAYILENQLIKTFKPRYNILLKDDKTYPYIKITTNEPFPRIIVTRDRKNDDCTYFGPYPSIGSTRKLRRLLYELFPIRDCKKDITLTEKQPKCLLLDIQKCVGPCIYKEIKTDYDVLVNQLILFLNGKQKHIVKTFKKEMHTYSAKQEFERAATYRDKIMRLENLLSEQRVQLEIEDNTQIWAVAENKDFYYLTIQEIINGKLLYQHGFFEARHQFDFESFLDSSVLHLLNKNNQFPEYIICEENIQKYLLKSLNLNDSIIHNPKIGEKKSLLDNARKNSLHALDRLVLKKMKHNLIKGTTALTHALHLKKEPNWILGFDISHLQSNHIVASSVSFRHGSPDKSGYRKFNIKTVSGKSNDPQSMYEVVYRRLRACKEDGNLPDLLLIDGGKGQLNFALKAVYQLELTKQVELVALAKREEECFVPHQADSIRLRKNNPGLQLLQRVRDEAHRFAVTFQRQKRRKTDFLSELMLIEGMGVKRLNTLLKHYPDTKEIQNVSVDSIYEKTKLSKALLEKVKDSLNKKI